MTKSIKSLLCFIYKMLSCDGKKYIYFIISSDEKKVKIWQYTWKEFQLLLERVLCYYFYLIQEGCRAAINTSICTLWFLVVKGAVSFLDIRMSFIFKVIFVFKNNMKLALFVLLSHFLCLHMFALLCPVASSNCRR